MGKSVDNTVLDAAFDNLGAAATHMSANDTEPTTFAESVNSAIATAVMSSNDFVNADGDSSGRKTTVASKGGVNVDVTDDANHVSIVDSANSILLYVTTATSQQLTNGNTMNFQAWDIEIADPT